jgi:hypothetical protein
MPTMRDTESGFGFGFGFGLLSLGLLLAHGLLQVGWLYGPKLKISKYLEKEEK